MNQNWTHFDSHPFKPICKYLCWIILTPQNDNRLSWHPYVIAHFGLSCCIPFKDFEGH